MDDDRAEAFVISCSDIVFWTVNGNDLEETLESFEEVYQGYYGGAFKDPKTEFTYQYVEDTGMLSEAPEILERYFDYEAFGRDLFLESYTEINGFVFVT